MCINITLRLPAGLASLFAVGFLLPKEVRGTSHLAHHNVHVNCLRQRRDRVIEESWEGVVLFSRGKLWRKIYFLRRVEFVLVWKRVRKFWRDKHDSAWLKKNRKNVTAQYKFLVTSSGSNTIFLIFISKKSKINSLRPNFIWSARWKTLGCAVHNISRLNHVFENSTEIKKSGSVGNLLQGATWIMGLCIWPHQIWINGRAGGQSYEGSAASSHVRREILD